MAANMYRVGDYVYFEIQASSPYQVRRIEELNKTPNGNVEAKVMCFYRRRDISPSLILLADKHQSTLEGDQDVIMASAKGDSAAVESTGDGLGAAMDTACMADGSEGQLLTEQERHMLKHRELFLSRQVETLPATHIRGKCSVTLLNETEAMLSYMSREDTFFYSLVYDPQQKTLLADKGEIRVGQRYQADPIPALLNGRPDERDGQVLEELLWSPPAGDVITDRQIEQFLLMARSVGTFARALDSTSSVRQPSLHMSAAAASRDVTLFHAMDVLHQHRYNIAEAICSLVPAGGPVLCRDEMEEWSASEANLFEEALDKYGKDFNDIRQDFLSWKTLKSVIEYYYMWKTTDRYVQQKRIKAAENESKLKQVYIPSYNKPNPNLLSGTPVSKGPSEVAPLSSTRPCESCGVTQAAQWYAWGPVQTLCRLCDACWTYWKKYGGLRSAAAPAQSSRVGVDGTLVGITERPPPSLRQERVAQYRQQQQQLGSTPHLSGPGVLHRCTINNCGKEFRHRTHLMRHMQTAHGLAMRVSTSPPPGSGSGMMAGPGGRPVMKTRAAFCLTTTPLTRLSRVICKDILRPRHAARNPSQPVNVALIKQECQARLPNIAKASLHLGPKTRKHVDAIVSKLGINVTAEKPAMLEKSPGGTVQNAAVPVRQSSSAAQNLSFGKTSPYKTAHLSPALPTASIGNQALQLGGQSLIKKRSYDQPQGAIAKRQAVITGQRQPIMSGGVGSVGSGAMHAGLIRPPVPAAIRGHSGNGRAKSRLARGARGDDAPDDVFFVATSATKKLRRQLTSQEFRKAARKPCRSVRLVGSGTASAPATLDVIPQ